MWEEKKRTNAWQWPEQEPTEFSGEKRALMELKENKEDELPLPKRPKPSSPTTNEWQSEYNPLKGPGSLGLKLDHSAFIEPFIEPHQKRRKNLQIAKKKDVKARFGKSDTIDKLKASNFQAIHLKIGLWEYKSQRDGDLVAKCYFTKHRLVWEVLDGRLKNKIEIQWEDIIGLKANFLEDGGAILSVTVGKEPLYFREMNPLPRKHTIWQASSNFTGGEARQPSIHYLKCGPGVLNKHYEKLLQCDTRLAFLSQQFGTVSQNPFPEACIKAPIIPHNIVSNYKPTILEGSIKASNVPYNIVSYYKPTILEGSIKAPNVPHNIVSNYTQTILESSMKAPNIPHNIVSNYTSEMSLVPCLDPIVVQPISQANFSQEDIRKNYINAWQDVNDCYNHDDMILSTSNCILLKDGNSAQKDTNWEDHVNGWQDGNDYSNLVCNLPPDDYYVKQEWQEKIGNASNYKQDLDMPRNDSLADFMYQLPSITSGFLSEDHNLFYP